MVVSHKVVSKPYPLLLIVLCSAMSNRQEKFTAGDNGDRVTKASFFYNHLLAQLGSGLKCCVLGMMSMLIIFTSLTLTDE